MPDLKLARLPDRTPVKLTITMSPQLAHKLGVYVELYNATYPGSSETVSDLVPYMLENFLDADRNFMKAFKEREASGAGQPPPPLPPRRKRRAASEAPKPATET